MHCMHAFAVFGVCCLTYLSLHWEEHLRCLSVNGRQRMPIYFVRSLSVALWDISGGIGFESHCLQQLEGAESMEDALFSMLALIFLA